MIKAALRWIPVVSVAVLAAHAQRRNAPVLSVCDIFQNLRKHANKTVTLKGLLYPGPSYTVGQPDCPALFVTDGFKWPTTVVLELPVGEPAEKAKVAREGLDRLDKAVLGSSEGTRISVTVTGILKLKDHYRQVKTHYGQMGTGFGYLGMSPAQLIISTIDDVSVLPASRDDKPPGLIDR